MRNSPVLPAISLIAALAIGGYVALWAGDADTILTELEIGATGVALSLAIYGLQGLISVLLEGQELRPGRVPPRLTGPLSFGIFVLSFVLFALAFTLAFALTNGWSVGAIGTLAGMGCIGLALLLVFYKEAFVGEESCFDDRQDGVPW